MWQGCGWRQFFESMEGFLFQSSFNLLENQNQNLWLPKDFIVFPQRSWDRFFPSRPSAKTLSGPHFVSLRKNNEKTFSIFFVFFSELTSVEVLGKGQGALVQRVSELHSNSQLDKVRHLQWPSWCWLEWWRSCWRRWWWECWPWEGGRSEHTRWRNQGRLHWTGLLLEAPIKRWWSDDDAVMMMIYI